MAEYKFGVLPEEENEEQLVTEEEQEYKFGQPLESREQDPLTKDVKSRSDEPLLQPHEIQKIPQYFKQAGIDLVKNVSGIPGKFVNSLKAQAYDDLLKDLEAELDTSEDTNSFKNKLARDRLIGYGFIRSEIEKDVGLKRSFFGSGDLALVKKSKEELQAVREKTQKEFIEWRDEWEKEHKEERALQQKRYKEAGFTSRTDQTITGAITSIGLVAPSLVAAYATKKPSLAYSSLPIFGTLTYGEVFEDSIARGLSIEDAYANAKIQATSEVVTELVPTMKLVKGINIFNKGPGVDYVKKILNNGAHAFIADATGEQFNTLVQSHSNAYFDNQDELRVAWENINNPFYEGRKVHEIVGDNMAHTLLATTIAGGTITGINTAIQLSPQMKSAIKNKGEQEGQQILDELSNLVTNKDMTKIALDKASARLNTPELKNNKNLDPMQIIAEEILKIDYVGKTEAPVTEDLSFEQEVKTKFNKPEEKKPDYQFGATDQLVTMPRKEAGKETSEINLETANLSETINKTQKNIELSLPTSSPINIQTIQNDVYDFNEVNLVENYVIDSRKFDPELFNDLPVRFSDTNLYRVRDFELEEKSNVAKAFIDINKAGVPMDVFSDLQFIGAHVKDNRFKDYTPAYGTYMPQIQGISLSPITGLGNLNFENQLGAKIQLRDTFIHELGHHIDFTIGKDLSVQDKNIFTPVTAKSPLFNIPNMKFENGTMDIDENSGGPVIREALQILQGSLNTPEDYYGGNMLAYPLGELIANGDQLNPGQEKIIRAETFAQMYDLYNTNRELVKEKAPITSKLIEDLNDAISVDGTTAKNEGVQRVFQSPSAKRSYEVPDRGPTTQQVEVSPEEQRARPRVEEPTRENDGDGVRPEISRIVGAPPGVDNQRKVGALRRKIKGLVKEGEPNRFWYEESSKAILDITNNNIEDADKLAQAIAITSPSTSVDVNTTFALQAYYQYKAGQPIETGRYPQEMSKKLEQAFGGQEWKGKKTDKFYNNLMRVIDPSRAQGVTVDLWMMRLFGYGKDTVNITEYRFVEEEINKIADEIGWEPQQVQAAAWVAGKAREEGTEVVEAGFNFSDAIQKNLGQISTETIPGRTNNHMNEMFEAPYEQVQEYHVNASKAILDQDGNDIIAQRLGILSPGMFEAPGYYEGKLSPGTQIEIAVPQARKTKDQVIQPEAEDLIKAYASVYGILFKQDAVGYHKPFYQTNIPKSKRNIHEARIGRQVTNEEIQSLADAMEKVSGKNYLNPIPAPKGVRFINFAQEDGINNIQFSKLVDKVLNEVELASNIEVIEAGSALGYVTNDWSQNKNGENYPQTSLEGRPDLQEKVRDIVRELQPRIDEVDTTLSEKYGWTRDESINSIYRDPAEIARRPEDPELDLSFEITKPPAPPGKPPSENYEWTSGDELNANLLLQKFLTKIQNQYERQVVLEEVIEDQLGMGILKDLDLSVVDKTDLMKSIVGDRMLKVSEEMETALEEMFNLADNSYANINEFLYNLHAPERNKYIYQERRAKVDAAIEKYGDNPTPAQKGQITRLTNLAKPFIDNGSGIKTEEAIETLKEKYGIEYNDKNDSIEAINETGKKYLKVSELANNFIQGTRNVYIKGGLVSEENIDDWSDRYKYYVPLSGFAADTNVDGLPNRKGKGLSVYGLEVPKAKGRTSMAGDPIIQMYKQRENAVVRDEKNSVVKTLADQARTFKNPAVYETLDKVPKEAKQKPEWDPIRQSAYVFFKEDGKQKSVVIRDERLARALQHLDTRGMNHVLQTIAILTRFMSVMNTGYNPDFVFPNFSRDGYAAAASALGEQSTKGGRIYGSKIVWKSMKNVFPRLGELYIYYRKGPEAIKDPGARKMIETYHAMGAKTSYFEFLDTDKLTKNFTALSKYRAGKISAQDLKRNTLDLIGDINNAIENGWRYSQFTEYVKQVGGIDNVSQTNLKRAAVQAKNASVNFDRRGEWGQEIGALLMFFNPAIQGSVQFMRGQNIFTKRGRKRLQPQKLGLSLGAASLGMLYTTYNLLMSGEDEDGELIYTKIPEFERNRNMLFVMPDEINMKAGEGLTVKKFGEDKKYMKGDNPFAISIPLSYGYNTHFNMGRLFIETQAHKIFPEKFKKPVTTVEQAGYELADGFITSFSPISPIDTSATGLEGLISRSRAFAPSAVVRPLLDIAANETYFGGPITKKDFPYAPKEPKFKKAFRGTEKAYVDFTEALNEMSGGNDYRSGWADLDPNNLKYFVDYHLGGAGRTVTRSADLPRKIKEDILTLEDIPVIRSFVAQPKSYMNGQLYYDRKDQIEALAYEYKNLNPQQKREFKKKENMKIVKLGDYMSPIEKKIFNKKSEKVKDATRPALLQAEKELKKVRDKMTTAKNLYEIKNPDKYSELMRQYDEEVQEIYQKFNKKYNKERPNK